MTTKPEPDMDFQLTEITASEPEEEQFEPPSGSKPGRVLLEVHTITIGQDWEYEVEVVDSEDDTAVFWLHEGMGIDYWAGLYCDFRHPGFYVIEGITVSWSRTHDGETDEDWDHTLIRPATVTEIENGTFD